MRHSAPPKGVFYNKNQNKQNECDQSFIFIFAGKC